MSGVTFSVLAVRATDEDGYQVMSQRARATMNPVIEAGIVRREAHSSYKGPDKFSHFEIELRVPWYRALSPAFRRMFKSDVVSLELWTELQPPEHENKWIHWLFPYSVWKRRGRTFYGVTWEGPGIRPDDIPDYGPIKAGGFWKTATPPPLPLPRS